jgi:hypothetical protein
VSKNGVVQKMHYMSGTILKVSHFLFGRSPGKWMSIIVGSGILFTSYLLISRTVIYNSDNASIILEAQSMLHGNYFLRGWYMPTDNFLTIEIPLYTLGRLLGFSMTSLLHIIPALLYTLVVIFGGYLASMLLQGKQRIWSLLVFLGIVAFPSLDAVQRLLIGPIHIGTVFFILVGLIAYKHFLTVERGKGTAFAIVTLVIVLTTVGDPFVLVLFVLPLILTEGIQVFVTKRLSFPEDLVISGVLLAVILSFGIRWILEIAGVHIPGGAGFVFTDIPGMINNLTDAITFVYTIFHANIFMKSPFSLSSLPLLINAIVVSTLIYAVIKWSKHSLLQAATPVTKIINVSVWSLIGILTASTVSTWGGAHGIRYLYPILFLSEIGSFSIIFAFVNRYVLIVATILVFVINAAPFAVSLYQAPTAKPAETQLLAVLEEHHLTQGLGTYAVSSIVTVQSEEQVVIRQVTISNHQIHPYYFLADEKWFDVSNLQRANFIVYRDSDDPQAYYDASVRSFGIPDHQYNVGIYTALTWNTPLLTHMQSGYSF